MHIYTVPIREHAYNYIKRGDKTIEGRLNIGIFKSMTPGDTIKFTCKYKKPILTVIASIQKYITFKVMCIVESKEKIAPYRI